MARPTPRRRTPARTPRPRSYCGRCQCPRFAAARPDTFASARGPQGRCKLISAETAQSILKPAADGRLPDLQLSEGPQQDAAESRSRSVHPLVLFGLLTLSVVISVVLALVELARRSLSTTADKEAARQFIEEHYFGGGNLEQSDLKPYQMDLRAAQRAHSRGDAKAERRHYRNVLDLLHAERSEDQRAA